MASIVDAFNEALNDDKVVLKVFLYAIPAYIVAKLFLVGKMNLFMFWGTIAAILYLALLTLGINNVRMNRREVLSLNPMMLGMALVKSIVVLLPQLAVFGLIGFMLVSHVTIPVDLPHVPLVFSIVVWSIIFSIIFTSYLSFAKYLRVPQGFNYKIVFESCIDVLIGLVFFVPQLIVANIILIGPVVYLYHFFFHLPYSHAGFVAYSSAVFVINISILANYMAQAAYEQIKGNNEDYDDHYNNPVNLIEEAAERINGR